MTGIKIVLIGHRGVGKSELLERLKSYFPQFQYFDLDAVIAEKLSNPVYKIFETFGEEYFRSKEIEQARLILNKKDVIVSLGAGFNLENLPEDVLCIWLRRPTDSDGRIFINRPALDKTLSPLEDYLARYEKRNRKYFEKADFIYDMPEGVSLLETKILAKKGVLIQEKNLFKEFLFRTVKKCKGVLTLNPFNVNSRVAFDTVEFRTDVFSAKEIIRLVEIFSKKSKMILSFRKDNIHDLDELIDILPSLYAIDVDSELGTILDQINSRTSTAIRKKLIISCHKTDINENIKTLDSLVKAKSKAIVKCSPVIRSFTELKGLYDWYRRNPSGRLIFPRRDENSKNSDWQWFRHFMLPKQVLNFINDGFSTVPDQPTLLDTFLYNDSFTRFAAVIGNPIYHSYSPIFHYEYMKMRNLPYYRIKIEEKEFDEALNFLEEIGMKAASITAPFKESAYRRYQPRAGTDIRIKSVNTVYLSDDGKAHMANTDTLGLIKTLTQISSEVFKKDLKTLTIVLWGGGGVVPAIKSEVPSVHLVASRDGKLPNGTKEIDILIWAAPRSLLTQVPKNCTIRSIFDLSYGENSMGLELAKQHNIPYFSGLEMFKEQARGQQLFWSQFDERK
jgi:shikimate 5-dehydrogenase/shikimate kinase